MELIKEYKIYQLDSRHLAGSDNYKRGLESRVCLIETRVGSFETMEAAFEYMLDNKMVYIDYTVLMVVGVRE